MHLGAAMGTVVIGIHGPTSFSRWGAKGIHVYAVESKEKCRPCISLGFESKCKNPVCMQHITVDMVWKQVKLALQN
jgi:heptosyltransferase I